MLRDHFRPPLDDEHHWASFHATWPVMIVANLNPKLPRGYSAAPRVYSGAGAEIDVVTFERENRAGIPDGDEHANGAGVATAVWAPPRPTLAVVADLPAQDVYEVLVYDETRYRRLVAAIEIASPSNKDRPEHRRAFAAKCAGLLRERVSVVIIDVVTTRTHNLYGALLDLIGQTDPSLSPEPPLLYAAACRMTKRGNQWFLETWMQSLSIGRSVPTVPLWLADDLALPLELQATYEQSCSILNIR